ncbi:hypothetical protein ADN00_05500 [Ornatilinea apprima]|uniref:Serine protease n=1 Tax=Ornatilinea apprima TaxID=1134406 RepID=A0A0P6XU90_9CHLR|nr:serine protease [Ornatilinea apprima]KPL78702.1 hypothetical protein ADN00_05500 [Ornatilinea apprima]
MSSYPLPSSANKPNRGLITCGIIAVALLCVGSLVAIFGFGVLASIFGAEPEGLVVVPQLPATVSEGQDFDLVVNLRNEGEEALKISEIKLPDAITQAASVQQVIPASPNQVDYSDSTGYQFSITLSPKNSQQVIFKMIATRQGDFTGDLDVMVGTKTKSSQVRMVVSAASAQPPSQPPAAPNAPAPTFAPFTTFRNPKIPYEAVVQISAVVTVEGKQTVGWTGSGSIISPDGYILSNAHVVLSDRYFKVEDLVISLSTTADSDPVPMYLADLLQADEALDIAVIRISRDLNGNPINPQNLNLPFVQLGDSDTLELGEPLTIIGYPGIGGNTVTLTSGEVSGFTAESGYGNRAFIKTSATIAGGNSGGLAANQNGFLIGIPTQLGYGGEDQYVDCRVLVDTNRDGSVDENDTCVPTGGFINALRPVKLALPLIDAARRGEVSIAEAGVAPAEEINPTGGVIYSEDFNSTSGDWQESDTQDGAVGYYDGQYYIQVDTTQYLIWSTAGQSLQDVAVTVDANVLNPTGVGDYGLICRYVDNQNFYGLEISEDGYFIIYKYLNGEYFPLTSETWTYSEMIPTGQPTQITATCNGNRLMLAVNNMVLAEVQDSSHRSGDVGLIAGTFDQPSIVVGFDNFTVRQP